MPSFQVKNCEKWHCKLNNSTYSHSDRFFNGCQPKYNRNCKNNAEECVPKIKSGAAEAFSGLKADDGNGRHTKCDGMQGQQLSRSCAKFGPHPKNEKQVALGEQCSRNDYDDKYDRFGSGPIHLEKTVSITVEFTCKRKQDHRKA